MLIVHQLDLKKCYLLINAAGGRWRLRAEQGMGACPLRNCQCAQGSNFKPSSPPPPLPPLPPTFLSGGWPFSRWLLHVLTGERNTTSVESPGFEVSTEDCGREQFRVSVLLVDGLFVWFTVTAAAGAAGIVAWHHRKLKRLHFSLHFLPQIRAFNFFLSFLK